MAALRNSKYVTAIATASEDSTSSSSPFFTTRSESIMVEGLESGNCSTSVEDQIEHSKSHWSEVVEFDSDDEEMVEISNMRAFRTLQRHPIWGIFFWTYDKDKLVMGEKFAEGGQAEIYEAKINKPGKESKEVVVKVFKKGFLLRRLQSKWPRGFLEYSAMNIAAKFYGHTMYKLIKHLAMPSNATMLDDGRFAFILHRHQEDLRTLIDRSILNGDYKEPFSKSFTEEIEVIMYCIARGMCWLHDNNIVHRDLKASNVLLSRDGCYVADFECSIGVIGTGFFRAPEILQACKDGNINRRPELFTKAADAYSYGMTCYEILTGKLPFENHSSKDYDVLNGHRPQIPTHVDTWIRDLLDRCWHPNPIARPSFEDILNICSANTPLGYKDRLVGKRILKERKAKTKYKIDFIKSAQ